MAQKRKREIKFEQGKKRRKRRLKLSKKGKNPNESFYGGYYVAKPLKGNA